MSPPAGPSPVRRGVMLVLSSPSGAGKSTITRLLLEREPGLTLSISATTRARRHSEVEGIHYFFVSAERFREMQERGELLESAFVHGNMYGTPRTQVEATTQNGKVCIMDIDVQGAKKLLSEYPHAVTIFLKPPSMDALRHRFIKRGVTSEADLAKRLESARIEMAQAGQFPGPPLLSAHIG